MKRKAFTLIELLVVVAVLAILSAAAVPNMLESQTRSKVSRMENDMRTASVAAEAYAVDHGKYPRQGPANTCTVSMTGVPELTTPIAYLSTYPNDIFRLRLGRSESLMYGVCVSGSPYYYFWSLGPDQANQMAVLLYDPTNGTASTGDLKRTTARDVNTIAPQ